MLFRSGFHWVGAGFHFAFSVCSDNRFAAVHFAHVVGNPGQAVVACPGADLGLCTACLGQCDGAGLLVPFGVWWSAVFAVSIDLPVDDIPPRFWDATLILIPAIILGDARALVSRRWRR